MPQSESDAGNSLVEMLAALAITSLTVGVFLPFVSQVFVHWQAGLAQAQSADQLIRFSIGMQSDLDNAVSIRLPTSAGVTAVGFTGTAHAFRFIRPTEHGRDVQLDRIEFAIVQDEGRFNLVRRQAKFDFSNFYAEFGALDSSVVIFSSRRAPEFIFVSADGKESPDWVDQAALPILVKLILPPETVDWSGSRSIDLFLGDRASAG